MNGQEHRDEAERLIRASRSAAEQVQRRLTSDQLVARAQVHAALALVDAIGELTEQASPPKPHAVYGRALEAVNPR